MQDSTESTDSKQHHCGSYFKAQKVIILDSPYLCWFDVQRVNLIDVIDPHLHLVQLSSDSLDVKQHSETCEIL